LKPAAGIQPRALLRVRSARLRDVAAMEHFIANFTGDGTLLPRTRANLVQHIRDFYVVWDGEQLIGCGALQLVDGKLAEIRSVAVHPDWRGAGLGGRIVEALLREARRLGVQRVFCLTRRESFFARLGFEAVPKERFPHKIWNDCRLCPRQTCCDETAMERWLQPVTAPEPSAPARATRPKPRAGAVLRLHSSHRPPTGGAGA